MPALATHERYDGLFTVSADHCVALPTTHLLTTLNVHRALTQRPTVRDSPPAIKPTRVTLSVLLLTAQVPPQPVPAGLVRADVLVHCFVAHWSLARDFLRAPVQFQQRGVLLLHPRYYQRRFAADLCTLLKQLNRLLAVAATITHVEAQLTADRGLATTQQVSNLCCVVCCFHKTVNVMTFDWANMFVVQLETSTCGSRSLECRGFSPPYFGL